MKNLEKCAGLFIVFAMGTFFLAEAGRTVVKTINDVKDSKKLQATADKLQEVAKLAAEKVAAKPTEEAAPEAEGVKKDPEPVVEIATVSAASGKNGKSTGKGNKK